MTHILTLIGNKATPLTEQRVEQARAAIASLTNPAPPDWLAEGIACDIPLTAHPNAHAIDAIRKALDHAAIDMAIVPDANRRKKLLVADMDSTIIEQECIDELAAMVGMKDKVAAITERAMRGDIAFEPALKERVALLKGLPLAALDQVYRERITETPGGRALTATMQAHGAICALVSGGFSFFTERVARSVGFQSEQANSLLHENGKLTGRMHEPILGQDAKLAALKSLSAEYNISPEETMAVGDGANDLAMIRAAGLGVAFHAKPVIAAQAAARIDHADLTALLYLQGYHAAEIIQP